MSQWLELQAHNHEGECLNIQSALCAIFLRKTLFHVTLFHVSVEMSYDVTDAKMYRPLILPSITLGDMEKSGFYMFDRFSTF